MNNNYYIRTYGRTRGRKKKISIINYKNKLKNYLFKSISINQEVILEIGSGNGENVIKLCKSNPKKLIIACEVYLDGNASLINKLESEKCSNIKIYEKSCFSLFKIIKNFSLSDIWILYPDPWPKKKHYKRRLISEKFIKNLYNLLNKNGRIYISTDSPDYFIDILVKFYKSKVFNWKNDRPIDWSQPFKKMAKTSYFLKAEKNKHKSNFMIFEKKI